jgi:lysophospholipase L1-like esterase
MEKIGFILILIVSIVACKSSDNEQEYSPKNYNILSFGDSYTIGQGVCDTCGFPEQLRDSLIPRFNSEDTFSLNVIAQTGWTTTNLISAIGEESLTSDYDLVTLLIGVNNQFQNRPFETFEIEFNEIVNTSIALAKGDRTNVVIINIIDYANTGFGQNFGGKTITEELTAYNAFIETYCNQNNLILIGAQNLIFDAQTNPELIATDNLHPSELAYSNLVTQLLPLANEILMD